jgi:glutathione synthase/RimK-type ligase-like ATP-grasp enzyme
MRVVLRRTSVSEGARALADALKLAGVRAILSNRTRFRRPSLIVNWGSLLPVEQRVGDTLNHPFTIAVARDKISTLSNLLAAEVSVPKFWLNKETAEQERGESIILERHSVTGQGGSGIVVKRNGQPLDDAPLYVEYIRKEKEFRVHVFGDEAIAVQEKRRESTAEQDPDQKLIRNHTNGWVFCVNDIVQPEGLTDLAVNACRAIQLDFGAVDMIQSKKGVLYVLEINTRPGLESPTVLSAYVEAIKKRINRGNASNTGDVAS